MTKRRYSDLLPGRLRTDDLRKFFSATVDQLFQPGRVEPLSGYIGRVPSYYDSTKDFYIAEPSTERQVHQLEAVMIDLNTESAIERVLFYDDLVSNLRSQGAITDNQSRMFEGDYYSWAPPVDLDKLNNPQNYYWFGDDPDAQPALPLTTPFATYTTNGILTSFALPAVVSAWAGKEFISVFVDGVRAENSEYHVVGNNVVFYVAPDDQAIVDVYRYGDLKLVIEGNVTFDPSAINTHGVSALTTGMRVELRDAVRRVPGFDAEMWDDQPWDDVENNRFLVDGVGVSITLLGDPTDLIDALYTVIDRRSAIISPWATYNRWVYRDAIAWAGETFPDRTGRRPIIEFRGDVELWNYGRRRMGGVDAVLSGAAQFGSGWEVFDWDYEGFDNITEIGAHEIIGKAEGTVQVDNNHVLMFGDRLLIPQEVPGHPELSHVIVVVTSMLDSFSNEVMNLVPEAALQAGDMVTLPNGTDYVFNGVTWNLAQNFRGDTPPLFRLYDLEGIGLDDTGAYPASTFAGSRLFSYADGTGRPDAIIGKPLRYDSLGQIVFENHLATTRYSYEDGEIAGYYFYKTLGATLSDDKCENDWHLVDAPSGQTTTVEGVHTIPLNLQANPDNEPVSYITRGEWFDHFASIMINQEGFVGEPYSINNWRDTARKLNVGTRIVQHRAPLLKTMLLSSDKRFGYLNAVNYVEKEYVRLRNRVAQRAQEFLLNGSLNSSDTTDQWLVQILDSLKISKTSDFPFALSLVGGGQYFIPPTPSVMGLLPCVAPVVVVDNTYGTPVKFLQGHDGSRSPLFEQVIRAEYDGAAIFVFDSEPMGAVSVTINGVNSTNFTVNSNVVTLTSMPSMGDTVVISAADLRDDILLAFEQRIYANIDTQFKTQERKPFELSTYVEGKFRDSGDNGYTREEFNQILLSYFLRWAQRSGFDFRVNAGFDQSDAFTWNYAYSVDRDGAALPGHWRGIYRWYFDTDRPHEAPWEMLGFASRPTWWVTQYGAAPYTRSNTALWNDLRDGMIRGGPRQGVDARYARPGLLNVLPVDNAGALLDPISAGIVLVAPDYSEASRAWRFGDQAPVENLWINSSSYGFAHAAAAYLMKPVRWVEFGWEPLKTAMAHEDQLYYTVTGTRPRHAQYATHGEIDPATGFRRNVLGIQQWIVETMISRGQDPVLFGDAVRGLGVRMAHKVAGFTSGNNLKVFADNFGLVPQEDVNVILHTSPSIRDEFYSGVIVEWTGSGYAVLGYDALHPVFNVIPSDTAGPKINVSISDEPEPVIVDWRANVYYRTDLLIEYKNSIYRCKTAHTSTSVFEQSFWTPEPSLARNQSIKVVKYFDALDEVEVVPYGTLFLTIQEVADFLFGYERYLESRGWVFDAQTDSGDQIDWTQAVRSFMDWSQIQWAPGNFITLSPGAIGLKFFTQNGMIYSLEDNFTGSYGIVSREGLPVDHRDTFVDRIDGEVTIAVRNDDLFGARVSVGEVEHVLVFSNTTIFNDIIYKPLLDLRQERLRLIGTRAPEWNGRLDAPGSIIIDGQVTSNFDGAAEELRYMFDIEGSDHRSLRDHARHLVGFETRPYLENLLLSDVEQFEFYQGMIHQKGAPSVFDKLMRSQFVGQSRDLKFLEEWGLKLASYGAIDQLARVSFDLAQTDIKRNPQYIQFLGDSVLTDGLAVQSFIDSPPPQARFFPRRNDLQPVFGDLPTAGPVRLSEVTHTCFTTADILSLYKAEGDLPANDRVWVYQDETTLSWNVMHVVNVSTDGQDNQIRRIEVSDNYPGARIYMERPHGLPLGANNLLIIIDGDARSEADIAGFQRVVNITSDYIEIEQDADFGYRWFVHNDDSSDAQALETADDPENSPKVRVLRSARFGNIEAANAAVTWMHPEEGELAYLNSGASGGWEVRRWTSDWSQVHRVQPRLMETNRIANALIYDRKTSITDKSLLAEPLVLDHILTLDPATGLIPGEAERELSYKLEYDPAVYVEILGNEATTWGPQQVGQLWWNLSTVRFLEAQTDLPLLGDVTRRTAEIQHRINTWGKIAPGTSIDIYEWVKSPVPPSEWTGDGEVFSTASYAETQIFDGALNRLVPAYFFWVKNLTSVPREARSFRNIDARSVARIIENPTALDIPWIAPISPDAFIVSGVSKYLTDDGTVMQVEIRAIDTDNVVHTEWELIRSGDDRSLPNISLWNKLVDSIAGMDSLGFQVPDMTLHPTMRLGLDVEPRQSMFATDDPRRSVLAARESFIEMINSIMARYNVAQDRPDLISDLERTDEVLADMLWTAETDLYFQAPVRPNAYEIDYVVRTLEERNRLLLSSDFRSQIRRVYIDRQTDQISHFSVWRYDPANDAYGNDADRIANADALFELCPSYDHEVSTKAEMEAGTWDDGEWIYVSDEPTSDGFWSIWEHNDGEFTLIRAQRYRLSDFWKYVDWYADGYSASQAPVVSYPSIAARNAAENPVPTSTFVRVDDDGTGSWAWTAFADGIWTLVARENGTIEFSEAFYDATRAVYGGVIDGLPAYDLSIVGVRDGAFELRVISEILWRGGLADAEINELFFSMMHFSHSHVDQVPWAFKTSFLYIAGFNEQLTQTPVAIDDNTSNLIDYINEVKPYRVKIREFSRTLTPNTEIANAHVADFDVPPYYDPTTGSYRRLSLNSSTDLAILTTVQPYKDWYDNYTKTAYDLETYNASTWNPVRKINTTLKFDRVDGVFDLDDGAWGRIDEYYDPTPDMPEKSLEELLKLEFKGNQYIGQNLTNPETIALELDGNTTTTANAINLSAPMNEPLSAGGRPEEMALLDHKDHVFFHVTSDGQPGAPRQTIRFYDVAGEMTPNTTVSYLDMAQGREAVAVFADGLRLLPGEYSINDFKREVTVPLVNPWANTAVEQIMVQAMGFGGSTKIREQNFFTYQSGPQQFSVSALGTVEVIVNGEIGAGSLANGVVTVSGTLTAGDEVIINIRETGGNPVVVHTEELDYDISGTWTLANPSTTQPEEHAITIVERDGKRLTPAPTYYAGIIGEVRHLVLDEVPADVNNIRIIVDGVEYTGAIDTGTFTTVYEILVGGPYSGDWVLWDDKLVCVQSAIQTEDVVVYVLEGQEYEINAGVLTVPSIAPGEKLLVTTFTHGVPMGMRTVVRKGNSTSTYVLPTSKLDETRYWVTLNGVRQMAGIDFSTNADGIYFRTEHSSSDVLVISMFIGAFAEIGNGFIGASVIPLRNIMRPISSGDWDTGSWDDVEWDSGTAYAQDISTQGLRPVHHMDGGWEYFNEATSNRGRLDQDVTMSSTELMVRVDTVNSIGVYERDAFRQPQPDSPGVVWIDGERIEYASLTKAGNLYTLSGLKRGTRSTKIGSVQRLVQQYAGNGSATNFLLPLATTAAGILVTIYSSTGVGETLDISEYTIVINGSGALVQLASAPANGEHVSLSQTIGQFTHKANAKVIAASNVYDPDRYSGNPEVSTEATDPWLFFF